MDTLCIKNKIIIIILFLPLLFLISCKKKKDNPNIPAYFFDEQIKIKDITDSTQIKILKVTLKRAKKKRIEGKVAYLNIDSTEFVRIYFEQIYDTITPKDTIVLFLKNDKDIYITEIQQMYSSEKPIFIQYKIGNKLFREGKRIVSKQ
jgi:lipoprotein